MLELKYVSVESNIKLRRTAFSPRQRTKMYAKTWLLPSVPAAFCGATCFLRPILEAGLRSWDLVKSLGLVKLLLLGLVTMVSDLLASKLVSTVIFQHRFLVFSLLHSVYYLHYVLLIMCMLEYYIGSKNYEHKMTPLLMPSGKFFQHWQKMFAYMCLVIGAVLSTEVKSVIGWILCVYVFLCSFFSFNVAAHQCCLSDSFSAQTSHCNK